MSKLVFTFHMLRPTCLMQNTSKCSPRKLAAKEEVVANPCLKFQNIRKVPNFLPPIKGNPGHLKAKEEVATSSGFKKKAPTKAPRIEHV